MAVVILFDISVDHQLNSESKQRHRGGGEKHTHTMGGSEKRKEGGRRCGMRIILTLVAYCLDGPNLNSEMKQKEDSERLI